MEEENGCSTVVILGAVLRVSTSWGRGWENDNDRVLYQDAEQIN